MRGKSKETKESPFNAHKPLDQRLGIQGELFVNGSMTINGLPGSSSMGQSQGITINFWGKPRRFAKPTKKDTQVLHGESLAYRAEVPSKGSGKSFLHVCA